MQVEKNPILAHAQRSAVNMPLAFTNPGTPLKRTAAYDNVQWNQNRILTFGTRYTVLIIVNNYESYQNIQFGEPIGAVALDQRTGFLAIAHGQVLDIYKPADSLKWTHHYNYITQLSEDITQLSWGYNFDLLLCASSYTKLINFSEDKPRLVWSQNRISDSFLSSTLSSDACFIASIETKNPLAKVWQRTSPQGTVSSCDDFSYLVHPCRVRFSQWSKHLHPDASGSTPFLSTVGYDNVLRIWQVGSRFGSQLMHLSCFLNLRKYYKSDQPPYCCFIDKDDFTIALAHAISRHSGQVHKDRILNRLLALASGQPHIFLLFTFECLYIFSLVIDQETLSSFELINQVPTNFPKGALQPDGFIPIYRTSKHEFYDYNIILFFQNSAREYMFSLTDFFYSDFELRVSYDFYGHDYPIKSLTRTSNGHGIVSRDVNRICMFQSYISQDGKNQLICRFRLLLGESDFILPLYAGEYAAVLNLNSLKLWHCNEAIPPTLLCTCRQVPTSPIITFFILPVQNNDNSALCALTEGGHAWFWSVSNQAHDGSAVLRFIDRVNFTKNLNIASAVDVMGWSSTLNLSSLSSFDQEVFQSISKDGLLQTWMARVLGDDKAEISEISKVQTSIKSATMIKGSTSKKVAVVSENNRRLSIFDTRSSEFSEKEEFSSVFDDYGPINDLDWTSTPNSHSILAVGFLHDVILLCQNRRSYMNDIPCWSRIRRYNLLEYTNSLISDSSWLDNGTLVTAIGNGLFYFDNSLPEDQSLLFPASLKRSAKNIFDLAYQLNGILPVFHPQLLQQLLLRNQPFLFTNILLRFYLCLKDDVDMHFLLNMDCSEFYCCDEETSKDLLIKSLSQNSAEILNPAELDFEETSVSKHLGLYIDEMIKKLTALLKVKKVKTLTRSSQFLLLNLIEAFNKARALRDSLDLNGKRYCIMLNQYVLSKHQRQLTSLPTREMAWAFHSSNKAVLLDHTKKLHGKPLLWNAVEEYAIPFWLNEQLLKDVFLELSRNHYAEIDDRNPENVSLYHIALHKINVFRDLWRLASWHKESARTVKLLSNDFSKKKWKVVASKNAFALLSKHRYFYASAFFLLADSCYDAAKVCIRNLKSISLAIAMTRVYEGDDGPTLKRLINEYVLPLAVSQNDRWLTNWSFTILKQEKKALQSLVSPIRSLVSDNDFIQLYTSDKNDQEIHENKDSQRNSTNEPVRNKFPSDDPAFILLYECLRSSNVQIDESLEYRFVLHNANVYCQLGCDLIALGLLRNWKFQKNPATAHLETEDYMVTDKQSAVEKTHDSPKLGKTLMGQDIRPTPDDVPEFNESAFSFE